MTMVFSTMFWTFIYFTSLRERGKVHDVSMLLELEPACIRMWVAHSTTVIQIAILHYIGVYGIILNHSSSWKHITTKN